MADGLTHIHPTAIVDPGAKLGAGVEVGAYSVIGAGVTLGDGCRLHHHVSLEGPSTFGEGNEFFPFTSIGGKTQDLKYAGEPTYLEVGPRNVFREFMTVNRGTGVGAKTIIGEGNTFLAYGHIGHDCVVGSDCIFSNNATLGGHVTVGSRAVISGLAAVHQFCRIGDFAMIGGCTKIVQDAPPFLIADGNPAEVRAVNVVGMKRNGFTDEEIAEVRAAFKILYDPTLNTTQAVEKLEAEFPKSANVRKMIDFVRGSQRGIIR